MSHFTVAVFSTDGDYEKLLAPFNENLEVEAYVDLCKEEVIEQFEDVKSQILDRSDAFLVEKQEEMLSKGSSILEMSPKQFAKWYWDSDLNEEGALMTTYNPNSKWDWYVVGGRWSGMLIVKDDAEGERGSLGVFGYDREKESPVPTGYRCVDHAKVSDIEWDVMREVELQEKKMLWKKYMTEYAEKMLHAKTEEEKESERRWLLMTYGMRSDVTEEKYLDNSTGFTTFAVITPDGAWHERGAMGWFGIVQGEEDDWAERYKERFLDTADPDWYLTVVDCHI